MTLAPLFCASIHPLSKSVLNQKQEEVNQLMELSSRIFLAALLLPAAIEVGPVMVAEAQEELLCEECQDFPFLDCEEGNCQCGSKPPN